MNKKSILNCLRQACKLGSPFSIFKCLSLVLLLSACEDYLSERPSKGSSEEITNVSQLEALLNNADAFMVESSLTSIYSSDDYYLPPEFYKGNPNIFQVAAMYYYTLATDGIANDLPSDATWRKYYTDIFTANLILEKVDEVEGYETVKKRVKAEAHFLRAYSNWMLVNYYRLPHSPENLSKPGLLKKLHTDKTEIPMQMTLGETYDFIYSDLQEALKTDQVSVEYSFRASQAAVYAFLSRYHLHRGEYEKTVEAADKALLNAGKATLKDYVFDLSFASREMEYPDGSRIRFCETREYTRAQMVQWPESFYIRLLSIESNLLNSDLLSLYISDDTRKEFFIRSANSMFDIPVSLKVPKVYNYNVFGTSNYILSGPTVQEVMLNKAEALLRQSAPDMEQALNITDNLRNKRIRNNMPLPRVSTEQALLDVLKERRREMPYAMRWFDVRRFGVNKITTDDVIVSRSFFTVGHNKVDMNETRTYTLDLNSPRYASPINSTEIMLSKGLLVQNDYSSIIP